MKVLITGGAGFVASHIADALFGAGHEILIVDNMSTGKYSNMEQFEDNIPLYETDIRDEEQMDDVIGRFLPDVICHQAAQPSLLKSCQQPDLDAHINIVGSLILMKMAVKYDVKQFVFASTSAVFPAMEKRPDEETPTFPERPYGIAKATVESYLLRWYKLPFAIIRYGNVYGPRQRPIGENQLIARLFDHIYRNQPFTIYGDGSHARDYVYVSDIADINLAVIEHKYQGIFHAGWGRAQTVNDIVKVVCEMTGYNFEDIVHTDPVYGEPKEISLLSRKRIWTPHVPMVDGLRLTMEWWKDEVQC